MPPEFKFFIIPLPRTGGTLLATMLNAHPLVSMGYELYPDRLCNESGEPFVPSDLINRLHGHADPDPETWARSLEHDNFRVFVARARRSGLEPADVLESLVCHVASGRSLQDLDDRLDFVDGLLERQALRYGKPCVGSKMRVDPAVLRRRHPDATFLMMLRDGRDVLDSRLHVGSFQTSPEDCAQSWAEELTSFESFLASDGVRGMLVHYEALVLNPGSMLKQILALGGLDFDELMLTYEQQDQAIFQSPHGHLSAQQLKRGISDNSVGRWKTGLSAEQVEAFEAIAGETLAKYGYL